MLDILLNNYLLIINLIIPFALGLFFVLTNKEYSLKEFGVQMSVTFIILISAFWAGYGLSDVYTKSYKSTNIQKFIYEEEWTELVTYTESYKCGKNNCTRTKTRTDYHPDRYYIKTSFDTLYNTNISKDNYFNAKTDFGEKLIDSWHSGQISIGNGRTYEVKPNKFIAFTDYDSEVNYIYASKTNIIKSNEYKDLEQRYKSELKEYPEISKDNSQYGTRNFDRVINSNLISEQLATKLQFDLEQLSINFPGNPIIYLTSSEDRNFAYVVKGYYKDMYFNDAMLVIGIKDDKILWTEPVSISKSAEFKVYATNLTDNFQDLIPKYSEVLEKYWKKPDLNDFKYLAGDIEMPIWYSLLIVITNIIGSFFVFRYMFKHEL